MSSSQKQAIGNPTRRVLLLDDHPLTRQGIRQLLNSEPDLEVCGEAGNAHQALTMVGNLHPDLVLADIRLPTRSGLEFIKDMKVTHPGVPVLAMSMHDEKSYATRALHAGARGYVMKTEETQNVLAAIHKVLAGGIYISPEFSQNLLKEFAANGPTPDRDILNELSDREFEVYQLIGQGLGTEEIGRRLCISPKTVESHRIYLRKKLNLQDMQELNAHAIRWATSHQLL